MAKCGIARIDSLFEGAPATAPISAGDADGDAVGAVQDLLRGHGLPGLPDPRASSYGVFGDHTQAAVSAFRENQNLGAGEDVDSTVLQSLVNVVASTPVASRPYVTLHLDLNWSGLLKVVLATTLLEGGGKFSAFNANTDTAGLSYGIIQWAQRPGRLKDVLNAFKASDAAKFAQLFGDGDARLAAGLLAHVAKLNGGVDKDSGVTTDPAFDLIVDPWKRRFLAAAIDSPFQTVQVQVAIAAFKKSLAKLRTFGPDITSERGVAFMLDLANQHGDDGAEQIYDATKRPGQSVDDHLRAMVDESVKHVKPKFEDGTRARRALFLSTPMFTDDPFQAA